MTTPQCLINQIQVQQLSLAVVTNQVPDHTQSRDQYHQHRQQYYRYHHQECYQPIIGKVQDQRWSLEELQYSLVILVKTSNPESIWKTSHLEIRKKATFLQVINTPIIYKFFKDFVNHRETLRTMLLTIDYTAGKECAMPAQF